LGGVEMKYVKFVSFVAGVMILNGIGGVILNDYLRTPESLIVLIAIWTGVGVLTGYFVDRWLL
jgi:hypothetical protein